MERKWWTLIVVCVATFMLLLDITIVNVALPKIAHSLHATFSRHPVGDRRLRADARAGAADDRRARRPPRAKAGVHDRARAVLRRLAALRRCRRAPLFLMIARGAQGIGGAIMFATSLALLAQEFRGRDRGTAFGDLGRDDRGGGRDRPAARRRADRRLGWRVDLLHQRADRRSRRSLLTIAKVPESTRPRREADRLDRARSPSPAACSCSCSRLIRGNRRLGAARRSSGCSRGGGALLIAVRRLAVRAVHNAMFDVSPVPQAGVRRGRDRRIHDLGLDVRDVPLPDALHADDPRALAAADRAAIPAVHPDLILRRRRPRAGSPRESRCACCSAPGLALVERGRCS